MVDRREALAGAREVIESVVWATMATVGPDGAPRTRIVHPIWDWEAAVGWTTSRGTPLRRRHLAHQPATSLSYWSPAQDVAYIDAIASWVTDDQRRRTVWDSCSSDEPPMGFDPSSMFAGGPDDEGFAPIELTPVRIRVVRVADVAAGSPGLLWAA